MRKEYNNQKAEFDRKQRELRALEDAWDDLKKEAVKPNSEEVGIYTDACIDHERFSESDDERNSYPRKSTGQSNH